MSGCNSWKFIFSIFLSEKTIFDWTNWWPTLTLFHLAEFSNERRNQIRQENMFFYGVGGIGWLKWNMATWKARLTVYYQHDRALEVCIHVWPVQPHSLLTILHMEFLLRRNKQCGRDIPEYFLWKCWDLNQRDPLLVLDRSIRNMMFTSLIFYVIDYHFSAK